MTEWVVTLKDNGTAVAGWSGEANSEEQAVEFARAAHNTDRDLEADVEVLVA